MPSPFPGMDPYIEACGLWSDFHHVLTVKIYEHLADTAPDRYLVRTEERNYIAMVESEEKLEHPFLPDVSVSAPRGSTSATRTAANPAVADLESEAGAETMCAFIEEEHREGFVEIFENTPEKRLVTAIEVLSPSNKRPNSEGRAIYLRKRQSLLLGGVHFIEIDLLRGGEKMPMLDRYPQCPYTLLVARARLAQRCKVWRAHYRTPLPAIPVPLLKGDADLKIDLQPMVDSIYRRSRYSQSIDYSRPLAPPLDEADELWLRERLRPAET